MNSRVMPCPTCGRPVTVDPNGWIPPHKRSAIVINACPASGQNMADSDPPEYEPEDPGDDDELWADAAAEQARWQAEHAILQHGGDDG